MQIMLEQIQAIVGQSCSLADLFSESFVENYTKCTSADDFNERLPFNIAELGVVKEEELSFFCGKIYRL